MKALSLRQPWCDAVLYGGKRVENRVKWKGCNYRGPLLLHAAKGCTLLEYRSACDFMFERGLWQPKSFDDLIRGAIVGSCTVVDVIMPGGIVKNTREDLPDDASPMVMHPLCDDPWFFGKFALVLSEVRAFERPIPYKGMLGLFNVDESVLERG